MMLSLKATPAGRPLWVLGTPLVSKIGSDGLVNCWGTTVETAEDFIWATNRLMVGGGVGYSVENVHVDKWPMVAGGEVVHSTDFDAWTLEDTREAWAELVGETVETCLYGGTLKFNTASLRPQGAPLRTFGGTASGPLPLIDGVRDIAAVINARAGKHLRSIDLSDIMNIVGRLVVAGSKRRSAQLALGSHDDTDYLGAKRWSQGDIPGWRSQANFSVNTGDPSGLGTDFWQTYADGEPFGIVDLAKSSQFGRTGEPVIREDTIEIYNPCGEASLPKYGSCNLATLHLPNLSTFDEALDAATLLYKVQKAISALPHPHEATQRRMNGDSRLGLSMTGYLQATEAQREWMPDIYSALRIVDKQWSKKTGRPESVRLTAVKPEGTVSLLSGCTSGIHAAYADQYIRRVRLLDYNPAVKALAAAGVRIVDDENFDGSVKQGHKVAEFVVKTPIGTPTSDQFTAVDQLEVAARVQREWADQAVSVTVTFKPEELPTIKSWLGENWDQLKCVSFLPYSDHGFRLAPYEPISESEFMNRSGSIRAIDWSGTEALIPDMDDCSSGACPIR
jgi:ribonucleoside-diphosphate reductase alpha chain